MDAHVPMRNQNLGKAEEQELGAATAGRRANRAQVSFCTACLNFSAIRLLMCRVLFLHF